MSRLGVGLGLNLVPRILGSGSLLPTDYVAHYLAREQYLTLVPTNSVSGWADTTSNGHDLEQTTSAQQPTYVEGYKGVGDEKVTNGDFSDGDTDWSLQEEFSVIDNKLVYNGDLINQAENIGGTYISGETYLIEFDYNVISRDSVTEWRAFLGNEVASQFYPDIGQHKFSTTFTPSVDSLQFKILKNNASGNYNIEFDNFTIKLAQRDTSLDTVLFDGTDDNMVGLPPQSGDFSYVFKGLELDPANEADFNVLIADDLNVKSLGFENGLIRLLLDTEYLLPTTMPYNEIRDVVFLRSGIDYLVYINGIYQDSATSGSTFDAQDTLGGGGLGTVKGTLPELGVYDRVLTLEEIEKISGVTP